MDNSDRVVGSQSFSHNEDDSPFFADITLDLAEAHDIAETPEPTLKQGVNTDALKEIPRMPSIPDSPPHTAVDDEPSSASSAAHQAQGHAASATSPVSPAGASLDESFDDSKPLSAISSGYVANDSGNNASGRIGMSYDHRPRLTPSLRRWPRDVQWAVAFCIVVPLCLLMPMIFAPHKPKGGTGTETWLATAPAPRLATLHTLMWGYGASLILSRLLYRTMGGGDGDDARHIASQVLLVSAPISVSVYVMLVVVMYFLLPHALLYLLIPLWYLARDLFLFRSWKMNATTPGGRQAFFQALTCMTLDILSRSLRRSSFYRIVSLLVIVQLLVIGWWRWALLAALRSHSWIWIFMAILGGKWATGTVARLLTLIAAGGIQSWFAQQELLVREMEGGASRDVEVEDAQEEMIEFAPLGKNTNGGHSGGYANVYDEDLDDIQEAYRTVDASIYKSSLVPDEGIDDDFEDEVDEEDVAVHPRSRLRFFSSRFTQEQQQGSSVKYFLFLGLTQSFGSVAKCGLLGGFAQFVWSQLRKIDTARATFRSMSIGREPDEGTLWNKIMLQANILARDFVRNNSDMAMSHVAAFSKPYHRAAQDVAILIDESGMSEAIRLEHCPSKVCTDFSLLCCVSQASNA